MRLFIAADLDDGAREAVSGAVTRLRDDAERDRQGSTRSVAWVEARNLHLTLHFLGEIDEVRLPSLRSVLAPGIDLAPPRVRLGGWGVFPPRGPARVVWLGVHAGSAVLASAHAELGRRLRAVRVATESRPFSPHLTVGRVKIPAGLHWNRLVAARPPGPVAEWVLAACTLFQSHLSPAGPTYRGLLSIPFVGDSGSGTRDAEAGS
jgi:2'-5' RNA ligase